MTYKALWFLPQRDKFTNPSKNVVFLLNLYLNLLDPIFLLLFYFLDVIISFASKSASDSL